MAIASCAICQLACAGDDCSGVRNRFGYGRGEGKKGRRSANSVQSHVVGRPGTRKDDANHMVTYRMSWNMLTCYVSINDYVTSEREK